MCGKYGQAGRIRQWIAQSHEESNEFELAISEYKMTAKYFEAKEMSEQVLNCERRIAHLLCLANKYQEASTFYQSIGIKELRNNLTKYNSHQSFLKSSILLLLQVMKDEDEPRNFTNVHDNMKVSMEADCRFKVSASCDFLHNIVQMLIDKDSEVHMFVDHLYDFNSLYPLSTHCLDIMEEVTKLRYQDQLEGIENISSSEK